MWQPTTPTNPRRIAYLAATLFLVVLAAVVIIPAPGAGQAELDVDSLEIDGVEKTVDGDVSEVQLSTELDYQYDVPNADSHTVTLYVAPEGGNYETVTYNYESSVDANTSGSVALSGDITEHSKISASDIDPAVATTETTTVQIKTDIEVTRDNGDPVTDQSETTATIQLTDSGSLEASVGGTGELTVTTA